MKFKYLPYVILITFPFFANAEISSVVSPLIDAFKKDDRAFIAKVTTYPLKREAPVPSINNEQELLYRFDAIFDSAIIKRIVDSDLTEDWHEMGWRGIKFLEGEIWLNVDGTIFSVNYQSQSEQLVRNELLENTKKSLHSSVSTFRSPILEWETSKFRIRLDELDDSTIRYSVWSVDSPTFDKPDLILRNGEYLPDGSGGNHFYKFTNGQYTYECYVMVLGTENSPPGALKVYKGNKLILEQEVVAVVR